MFGRFAVNDEENPLCELFITSMYTLIWIQLWAWNNNKTASLLWQPFYAVQLNAHDKELQSHIQCSHRQMYLRVFKKKVLLTQTNKKQRTDLANSMYRKWMRKNYIIIVLCGVSVGLLTNNKKPANNTCKRTAKNIWNSSLVTRSVLIFINLQTTYVALVTIFVQFLQNKKREGTLWVSKSGYCPCLLAHGIRHIWGLFEVCFWGLFAFSLLII